MQRDRGRPRWPARRDEHRGARGLRHHVDRRGPHRHAREHAGGDRRRKGRDHQARAPRRDWADAVGAEATVRAVAAFQGRAGRLGQGGIRRGRRALPADEPGGRLPEVERGHRDLAAGLLPRNLGLGRVGRGRAGRRRLAGPLAAHRAGWAAWRSSIPPTIRRAPASSTPTLARLRQETGRPPIAIVGALGAARAGPLLEVLCRHCSELHGWSSPSSPGRRPTPSSRRWFPGPFAGGSIRSTVEELFPGARAAPRGAPTTSSS
jgi:hypothetical protein